MKRSRFLTSKILRTKNPKHTLKFNTKQHAQQDGVCKTIQGKDQKIQEIKKREALKKNKGMSGTMKCYETKNVLKQNVPNFKGEEEVQKIVSFCDNDEPSLTEMNEKSIFSNNSFRDVVWTPITKESLTWKEKRLNASLLNRMEGEGFTTMTWIQQLSMSPILQGKDVLIRSETGSGKTLAFLVPAIQILLEKDAKHQLSRGSGTRTLILGPTRELINQTMQLSNRLTSFCPRIVVTSLTGGEKRKSEKGRLRKGVTLLGCTVGRLCDHLTTTASFTIVKLKMLILDEADRLLDMGFENKIRWIVKTIQERQNNMLHNLDNKKSFVPSPKTLQSILISATLSHSIKRLAAFILRKDESVWIGHACDSSSEDTMPTSYPQKDVSLSKQYIPDHIDQCYTKITLKTKLPLLLSIIYNKTRENQKMVIFCSNSFTVEYYFVLFQQLHWFNENTFMKKNVSTLRSQENELPHYPSVMSEKDFSTSTISMALEPTDDKSRTLLRKSRLLQNLGKPMFDSTIHFYKLHGHLPQPDRLGNFNEFNKCTKSAVLFTTDVAARGLNLSKVQFILQADPPQDFEDYVHRVGRTGRLDQKGSALLLLLDHEEGFVDYLKKAKIFLKFVPEFQLFQPLVQEFVPDFIKKKRLTSIPVYLTSFIAKQVEADIDLLHHARRAFSGSYRAYRCFSKTLKCYFDIKKLHLGHQATSLGLTESPSFIGQKCREGAASHIPNALNKKNYNSKLDLDMNAVHQRSTREKQKKKKKIHFSKSTQRTPITTASASNAQTFTVIPTSHSFTKNNNKRNHSFLEKDMQNDTNEKNSDIVMAALQKLKASSQFLVKRSKNVTCI